MSEIADRYRTVAAGFATRLAGVAPEEWTAPTPCPDWTACDLVVHVIGTQRGVLTRLDGTEPVEVEPRGDLRAQFHRASQAIADALGDETQALTIVRSMFGEQSFESLVGRLVCTDLLVHTRDLARATGQDETLDPGAVARSEAFLASIDDALRVPGGFAPQSTRTTKRAF